MKMSKINDTHLLVVDDDDRIRSLLHKYLCAQGFLVSVAASAMAARKLLKSLSFDLIVLDVMMPGEDGFSLTKHLRQIDNVPILLLTARGNAQDRIKGLTLGADDYLAKPFEPEELVLRIKSILKRAATKPKNSKIRFGCYIFDIDRKQLECDGKRIHLTTGELGLLLSLTSRLGQAVSRHALVEQIGAGSERAVDVQITRLRRKLEKNPAQPEFITTIRNKGYALQAEPYDV